MYNDGQAAQLGQWRLSTCAQYSLCIIGYFDVMPWNILDNTAFRSGILTFICMEPRRMRNKGVYYRQSFQINEQKNEEREKERE